MVVKKNLIFYPLILVCLAVIAFKTPSIRRDKYLTTLVAEISDRTAGLHETTFESIITPFVKNDRKDKDQLDLLTVFQTSEHDLVAQVMILPSGISEPFQVSVLTFNITRTEELFMAKAEKNPLPDKLNRHKLMKPCLNEVEIPLMSEVCYQVTNMTTIEKTDKKLDLHNLGYCTKAHQLTDRYIEVDGKSSTTDKFKFEFALNIMQYLYPALYQPSKITSALQGWGLVEYFAIIIFVVAAFIGGHHWYFRRQQTSIINKINNDVELQARNRKNSDDDIEQFLIEDEPEEVQKSQSKKVSLKNAKKEEMSALMKGDEN